MGERERERLHDGAAAGASDLGGDDDRLGTLAQRAPGGGVQADGHEHAAAAGAADRADELFGLGPASAVLFDAFVIRLVLVPALMHLFGRASWWMPAGLSRRLPRLSIEGPEPRPQEG